MPGICAECGAVLGAETSCQEIFDSFLVLEFSNPAYGAVHFLTVACFMIQHGRYSDEGLKWIAQKLHENLEEHVSTEQIRRQAAMETNQARRSWKVMRPPGAPSLPKIAWSMTIADVARGYRDAESYCGLIEQWARTSMREMKAMLREA